jgi:hypothetical protein
MEKYFVSRIPGPTQSLSHAIMAPGDAGTAVQHIFRFAKR